MNDQAVDQPEYVTIKGKGRKVDYTGNLGRERDEESDGPSDIERWQKMADDGDIRALLREASGPVISNMHLDTLREHINAAVEKLAREDPASFTVFLHSDMLACAGKMMIRAQYLFDKQLGSQRTDLRLWADTSNIDDAANKVASLMAEISKLMHANAVTQLALEQARKTRLANDKAEAKKSRSRRPRQRRVSTRPHATSPNSRVSGAFP